MEAKIIQKVFLLQVPGVTENLKIVRDFINEISQQIGFSEQETAYIELAMDETCANVIEHAIKNDPLQKIVIHVKGIEKKFIEIKIEDKGESFEFPKIKTEIPDIKKYLKERKTGGLGLYLISTLMDKIEFLREGNKNVVLLRKNFIKRKE
ncbi:ATP-binding protein [bacterium]|nr:ATP-binding protein [bacterium]